MKGISHGIFVLFVLQLIASNLVSFFADSVWKDMMLVHGYYSWIPPSPFVGVIYIRFCFFFKFDSISSSSEHVILLL